MHDCRLTQEHLLDLIFDELDAPARVSLLAEVDRCARCGIEYRSLAATLRACDEVAAIAQPQAGYWPVYHDALSHRLRRAASTVNGAAHSKAPIWRHLFNTSLSVPAPLAAIVLLLLLASSILSLFLLVRPAPAPIVINAPHTAPDAPQVKLIEVPVVRDRMITQTIHVRRRNSNSSGRRRTPRVNLARFNRPEASRMNTNVATRAKLSGFKPAEEVKIRLIRKGDANEQQ
jgi:hypothetical protein